jgi:membrane protein
LTAWLDRARPLARAFVEHDLATFTAALAYRVLVSLPALALLTLGLLSATGKREVWDETLGPTIRDRVTAPVFTGVDFSVDRIFETGAAGLIALAAALLVWELARAVRTVTKALNVIFGCDETRSWKALAAIDVALALGVGAILALAVLVVAIVPRLADGSVSLLLTLAAWGFDAVLLGLAIALLVRYAPARRPGARWVSGGAVLTVVGWILTSALFGWWAGSVANYKTAVGALAVFLVLSAYVFALCAVFLGGVQLDALARERAKRS